MALTGLTDNLDRRRGGPLVGQVYCPWLWANWRTGYDTLRRLRSRTVVVTDSVEHEDLFPWPKKYIRDIHGSDLSDIDVFHVHNGWTVATRGCELVRRFPDKKFVCTLIGTDINVHAQGQRTKRRYREFFEAASVVVCISSFLAEKAVALGCDPEKISVVHLGVDQHELPPAKRPEDFSPEGVLEATLVARFVAVKNIEDAILAAGIAAKEIEVHLNVCGNGSLRPKLEELADLVNFESGRTVVTVHDDGRGMFSHDRAMEVLARSDCIVSCSKRQPDGAEEGLGVSIIEGQMLGLPAIAYWTGGVGEIVWQSVTGWLARATEDGGDPGEQSPEGLANAMVRLARNRPARVEMGKIARRIAIERFSAQRTAEELDAVYLEAAYA